MNSQRKLFLFVFKIIIVSNSTPIAKLIKTPSEIGCYLLKNEKDDILYIGKAKNLRKRISQHLQTNDEEKSKFLGLIDN